MSVDFTRAPFPVTYREWWLPPSINGNATLPPSIQVGHELTLTAGARKGTTSLGVHGNGSATSNIVTAADAVLNNQAKLWVFLRFKLDVTFSSAAATDQYLWTKRVAADDYVDIWLESTDGKLYFQMGDRAAGIQFTLVSTTATWNAGTWYTVLCSLSDTGPAQRMLVNGVAQDTDAVAAINTPNGGDMVILNSTDGGADGIVGIVSIAVIGTDDLSADEETDLHKGKPPIDTVNLYLYDEGRGVTAYGRGSGADNGVIDSAVTWVWGQVVQPLLSFNGRNGTASTTNVIFSGNWSLVWVGQMNCTYDGLSVAISMIRGRITADSVVNLEYVVGTNTIRWDCTGTALSAVIALYEKPVIGDYWIVIGIVDGSTVRFYLNGVLIGTDTGLGVIPAIPAPFHLGSYQNTAAWDISDCLMAALIEGAFTQKQVLAYSRYLKNVFNLPISI